MSICKTCKGSGKVQRCEFTPPFEKFESNCPDCHCKTGVLSANAGVIITQFILYMQNNAIWPHHQFIGDDPQALTPDELMIFKRAFIEELKGS